MLNSQTTFFLDYQALEANYDSLSRTNQQEAEIFTHAVIMSISDPITAYNFDKYDLSLLHKIVQYFRQYALNQMYLPIGKCKKY